MTERTQEAASSDSQGDCDMSTITRDRVQAPVALPAVGRGETFFGLLAIGIGLFALVAKFSGLFG
jgi:hypothetical protein